MKNRVFSLLLALALLAGMLPTTAWAAETAPAGSGTAEEPYQIVTGEELAWLADYVNQSANNGQTAYAILTDDIDLGGVAWTPIGKSGCPYASVFDGQGHTIRGLNISAETYDQGLFGYVNCGDIFNLTVEGTVTGTGGSAYSGGVGGIVGTLYSSSYGTPSGTASVVNCVSRVSVTGGMNVGGIVGIIGGNGEKTVQSCANFGAVTGNGNVGGLIGNFNYKGTLYDSYNRGEITALAGNGGGLVGQINDSSAAVRRCYSTGIVTGNAGNPVLGKYSSGTWETASVFYLQPLGEDSKGTAKTEEELKSTGFASGLGSAFLPDHGGLNGGYPILDFQVAKYPVSITVDPAKAEVTIPGAVGTNEEGVWQFQLPTGEYPYTVSCFGYQEQTGSLTVTDTAVERTVTLTEAGKKTVSFSVSPVEAVPVVTVTWNGVSVDPTVGMRYDLPYGDYHYTVKARGYAKKESDFTVNAASPATIPVNLTPSAAWDGESLEKPAGGGTETSPYQISTGEELAWLADYVNQSANNGQTACAILTDDIDLGGVAWTPIGKYGAAYASVFDGQGHTVKALKAEGGNDLGLFGYAQNATIRDLVVQGTVTGGDYVGGILGRANNAVILLNCGNEADVSATGTGGAGGITGRFHLYGDTASSVSGCYNSGAISYTGSGYGYAGGLVGYDNGKTPISGCYNAGAVTSGRYAGGIRGYGSSSAGTISYCYDVGAVTGYQGEESYQGAVAPGKYSSVNDCFYLDALLDANSGSQAKTGAEMKTDAFVETLGEGWKRDGLTNGGYPIRSWQKTAPAQEADDPITAAGVDFFWAEDIDELGDTVRALTPTVMWEPIPDAEGYVLTIWKEYFAPMAEGGYETVQEKALTLSGITGVAREDKLTYDLDSTFETLGEGRYYVTVTASGEALPSLEWAKSEKAKLFGRADPYNRMARVTGLCWEGTRAVWTARPDFDESNAYLLTLYKREDGQFIPTRSVEIAGNYHKVDCSGYFAVGGVYAFSVTALGNENVQVMGYTDSPESRLSSDPANGGEEGGVYTVRSADVPGGEHGADWVAITSAQQWMELADVQDIYDDPGDPTTSVQAREWGKKYYLANDLDFSQLSAAWAGKSKSIGNVTHRFMGILDGDGHKITGLTLSDHDSGLFSYIGSTGCVYDLTIQGANIQASDNAAVLAHNNFGTIDKCAVVNSNITADTGAVVGGMVSRNYGVIRESYVEGGSLCSNSDTATGHGGFAGSNEEGGRIERCWASMEVSTQSDYAGGFVGLCYGGVIRDCFALGNVSARGYSGGFVGRSVYGGNRYENCYAAGTVTVSSGEGHGFIGGNKPDSGFQYDQSEGVDNCWYNSASPADGNVPGGGISVEEMAENAFLSKLNQGEEVWIRSEDKNGGLPYLRMVKAPEGTGEEEITVTIALAGYDKEDYAFFPLDAIFTVTLISGGNTRVVDVMDAAQAQGLLTYSYDTTPAYGRYIHTINGRTVEAPDGWMFTLDDAPSAVSASLAAVEDGSRLLWFEGTTQNRFLGPTWAELEGSQTEWVDIASVEALLALANSKDPAILEKSYRLTADLDLTGTAFPGIGSAQAPFTGVFDGRGHTVAHAMVTGGENVGFFNVLLGGTVKNLTLTDLTVSGESRVGGLAGWAMARLGEQDERGDAACLLGSCSVSGTVTGREAVGGLVGLNGADTNAVSGMSTASAVHNCSARVTVTAAGANAVKLGGLVGENEGTVTASAAYGSVAAADGRMVGGLAGSNGGSVYQSHAEGAVTGAGYVGGFVGWSSGVIKGCYSLGTVTGSESGTVGGFAGSIGAVENAISAGAVTGGAGFAGTLSGQVAGATGQINVKNVFGNCALGLSPVGNTASFTTESQKAALAQMRLEDQAATAEKLYEMFAVRLPGLEGPARTEVMDAIAARYIESADGWTVLDMALYQRLEGKTAATSQVARQAALNAMIEEAAKEDATASDRSRLELTLRAIGVDSTDLYASDGTKLDNAAALGAMELSGLSHYSTPWLLLAELQGNVIFTDAQRGALLASLKANVGDGLFGYEWDGVAYSSPDTAGAVLAALAPLYETNGEAKTVVDAILAALPGAMDENGSFGNANADAMVIIGLVALGQEPGALKAATGASVVDGLLSYVNKTGDGFLYFGEDNALATEQGFRALVALALFDGVTPCNIYDFSATTVEPGRATGVEKPQEPSGPSGQSRITVTLTLRSDTETWIDNDALTLLVDSTVYHALSKSLSNHGMTAAGLTKGYVESVTKDGVTLAQFDKGPNSGWLYQVNGVAPSISFADYALKNGDDILWYYTANWAQEPDAGTTSGGSGSGAVSGPGEEKEEKPDPVCPRDKTCPVARFADADAEGWYHDGVHYCVENGLMTGTSETDFAPNMTTSRAMIVTILYRLAEEPFMPEANWGYPYPDVDADAYYGTAAYWARLSGVVNGYMNGSFGPEDPVTREQLALMLWRYAGAPEVKDRLSVFADADAIGSWSRAAMAWAVERGVLKGTDGGLLLPQGQATRAECAVMLARFCKMDMK